MDDSRLLRRYARASGFKALIYNFVATDRYFRSLFNFGPLCGPITLITCFLLVTLVVYTVTNWLTFLTNTRKFGEQGSEAIKRLPRKESVLQVMPSYNCVNKHLQQTETFLDKTKKFVQKEQLEVEIVNSRINSITELLNPMDGPNYRSKSSRSYYRENTPTNKLFQKV